MNKIICVIRDLKADGYGVPCVFDGPRQAVRSFCDLLDDHDILIGKHPSDFQLVHVGDWNADDGVVSSVEHVVLVDGATHVSVN